MKKKISLLLAAALLLGGLAGCGQSIPPDGETSSETSSAVGPSETAVSDGSSAGSDSGDSAAAQRVQIADDVFVTPVPADKPLEQLSDGEIKEIAYELFRQATLVWENLFAGVPYLETDQTQILEYDGDEWYPLKYIHSFAEYEAIVDSVFAKDFYSDHVFKFIKECMMEQNGKLYLCTRRVGGVSGISTLDPLGITKIVKDTGSIQVSALMKNGTVELIDGEYQPTDGVLCYTLLQQDGNWVLQDFHGRAE